MRRAKEQKQIPSLRYGMTTKKDGTGASRKAKGWDQKSDGVTPRKAKG
jgi:hypothetical protein